MRPAPDAARAAFRALSRRLLARRIAAVEPAVRVLLTGISLLVAAFAYWQVRIPLAAAVHAGGAPRAAAWLAGILGAFALTAGVLAGQRARRFPARPPGPEWLALPAPPVELARHALAEARLPAWPLLAFAVPVLVAGAGLVPPPWLAGMAGGFVVAWLEATRLGHAFAWRTAPVAGARRTPRIVRALAAARARARAVRSRPARWRPRGQAAAIASLDRARTFTEPAPRRAMLTVLGCQLAGLGAWWLPRPPLERAALAFAGFTLAAAALGAWSAALVAGDPANLWRPLPLGPRRVWGARLRPLALVALALTVAHVAAAAPLSAPARAGIAVTWPLPALLIATLALHHALSLYPDGRTAARVTSTWLGVSVAASVMIPLLGWIVLVAGAIHAARRVTRGFRSETR